MPNYPFPAYTRVFAHDSSSMSNIASSGMVGLDSGLDVGCGNHGLRKDEFTVVDIGTDDGDDCVAPLEALRFGNEPPRPDARGGDATPAEPGLVPVSRDPRNSEFLNQFVCCCWKPSWGLPPDPGGGLTGFVAGIRCNRLKPAARP